MGNPMSKLGEGITHEEPKEENINAPSTPILTAKFKNLADMDPRSPSSNVVRTPIQMLLSSKENSPDWSSAEDNQCDTFNINSPVPKTITCSDPRSPAADFSRTPIVLPETKLPLKLHNKNLDNVRKTLAKVTPKKISDMPRFAPPRLLESSPLVRSNEVKRKSFVGLLETNLDYVETDLDAVFNNTARSTDDEEIKRAVSSEDLKIEFPLDVEEEISKPVQKLKLMDVDDDGLVKQKTEAPKVVEVTPKQTKMSEFEKRITNLIYADEESEVTAEIVRKERKDNRTPLATRNGNQKKTVPKLKVSDKPTRKSEYEVSKIPVFKNKKAIVQQCENTPPRNYSDHRKVNRSQWDNDNTLVI